MHIASKITQRCYLNTEKIKNKAYRVMFNGVLTLNLD